MRLFWLAWSILFAVYDFVLVTQSSGLEAKIMFLFGILMVLTGAYWVHQIIKHGSISFGDYK